MPAPSFSLRPATASDADTIRRIIREAEINPSDLDWRRFTLAVTPKGKVIGTGQIKSHRDGSRELASIAVVPAWQGRGVARAIIERLIASSTGTLYLMCQSELVPLYQKFGFAALPQNEMPKYFRRLTKMFSAADSLMNFGYSLAVMRRG